MFSNNVRVQHGVEPWSFGVNSQWHVVQAASFLLVLLVEGAKEDKGGRFTSCAVKFRRQYVK